MVYLGSYRRRAPSRSNSGDEHHQNGAEKTPSPVGSAAAAGSSSSSHHLGNLREESGWKLCAVKRLHADKISQLVGLDEAFALRRLGSHPNVVKLIDIRDEVEIFNPGAVEPEDGNTSAPPSAAVLRKKASISQLGKGLPGAALGGTAASLDVPAIALGRSASDATPAPSSSAAAAAAENAMPPPRASFHQKDSSLPIASQNQRRDGTTPITSQALADAQAMDPEGQFSNSAAPSLHRRLVSQPHEPRPDAESKFDNDAKGDSEMPSWNSQPNGLTEQGESQAATLAPTPASKAVTRPATHDTPRLLILLELLPHSLYSYAKKHPERVDLEQWLSWAVQLADVLAWMHERGAVHADVKKENILVSPGLFINS